LNYYSTAPFSITKSVETHLTSIPCEDVLTIGASAFTRYDITQSLTYAEKIKLADAQAEYHRRFKARRKKS